LDSSAGQDDPRQRGDQEDLLPLNNIVGFPAEELIFTLSNGELIRLVQKHHEAKTNLMTLCQSHFKTGQAVSLFGVMAEVLELELLDSGKLRFRLLFKERKEITWIEKSEDRYICWSRILQRRVPNDVEKHALQEEIAEALKLISASVPSLLLKVELSEGTFDIECGKVAKALEFNLEDRLALLQGWSLRNRAQGLLEAIQKYGQIQQMRRQIKQKTQDRLKRLERDSFLAEEKKIIDQELNKGQKNCPPEFQSLQDRIGDFKAPLEVLDVLNKEFARLLRTGMHSPHASTIQDYLETLLELPWKKELQPSKEWAKVESVLKDSHFGLETVKERILRYLSVVSLTGHQPGCILCLVGPPGVGKTSFARAIAEALGLPFVKKSLGGVRDESEIRGHRRTYIGSMPGRIVQGLRKSGCSNPVFLLDEVDKMGNDHKGDPSSALLEVLDPEENSRFSDHYVELDIDLSRVFWVLTANSEENIPGPLRDRLEIVRFSGYTENEKLHIAKDYLSQRNMEKHGLGDYRLRLSDGVLLKVIREYTREAGVRELNRRLSNLVQYLALKQVQAPKRQPWTLGQNRLHDAFGSANHQKPAWQTSAWVPGVIAGLAWTAVGGTVMRLECISHEGKGQLKLTGKLGEVMQESAHTAFSFLKTQSQKLGVEAKFWLEQDYHIHIPSGAVPKEGPSAGLGLALLLASLATGRRCEPFWAMTGEITLHGRVLAIGGVKEKLLAAQQEGFKGVLLPLANKGDVEDLQLEELQKLELVYVNSFWEAYKVLFPV
jgi:ATP-dependent Lon protease